MRNNFLTGGVLITVVVMLLISNGFINKKNPAAIRTAGKGFAVVELFTSEGCSSCPPADAAIAKLQKKNLANTYILSFHVDYWNRLGWKDEFSRQAYSARQQQYARYLSSGGVYTPQVIVNGTVEFVGSKENVLNNTVNNDLNNKTESNVNITAQRKNSTVSVHYNINGSEVLLLNTAIVLPEAITEVRRGENGGRTLQHVNIVRDLKVIETTDSGEFTMEIPEDLTNKPFKVIAYTQAKQTFKILGTHEVAL